VANLIIFIWKMAIYGLIFFLNHDFFSFSEFFWSNCKILPQKKIEIHTQKKMKQARSRLES
jgi:hypothetical protein